MSKRKQEDAYETLHEQLRTLIVQSGLSTNALAKAVGVPQPCLHRFVRAERSIMLGTADKLCRFFGARLIVPNPATGRKGAKHGRSSKS